MSEHDSRARYTSCTQQSRESKKPTQRLTLRHDLGLNQHAFEERMQTSHKASSIYLACLALIPGLAHAAIGLFWHGIIFSCVTLSCIFAFISLWSKFLWPPLAPCLVLIIIYAFSWIATLIDLRIQTLRGKNLELRHQRRAILFPICFFIPIWATCAGIEENITGLVEIRDDSMFPLLLQGDVLLFDRKAYKDHAPKPGELAVFKEKQGTRVLRVIAQGQNKIHLRHGRPVINGRPLPRQRIEEMRVERFCKNDQAKLFELEGFIEENGESSYLVTTPRLNTPHIEVFPQQLANDELYTLGDNRAVSLSIGAYGKRNQNEILGRPLAIWRSQAPEGSKDDRNGRAGAWLVFSDDAPNDTHTPEINL